MSMPCGHGRDKRYLNFAENSQRAVCGPASRVKGLRLGGGSRPNSEVSADVFWLVSVREMLNAGRRGDRARKISFGCKGGASDSLAGVGGPNSEHHNRSQQHDRRAKQQRPSLGVRSRSQREVDR